MNELNKAAACPLDEMDGWLEKKKSAHIESKPAERNKDPGSPHLPGSLALITFVSFRSCIITHPLAGFTEGGTGVLVFASDFFFFFVKFY